MLNRRSARRHRSNSPYIIIFTGLAFLLGIAAGYLIWGEKTAAVTAETVRRVEVSTDGDPATGPANAPITIIEFSDYQCPYCREWYQQVYKPLMAMYPNQIRFVYRDFPLSGHPDAQSAAEAAQCAGDQNAYWQFHDALFSDQLGFGREAYDQYATQLNLDVKTFDQCLDDRKYQGEVQADLQDGMNAGVTGTPAFVINGRMNVGYLSLDQFASIIDEELDQK